MSYTALEILLDYKHGNEDQNLGVICPRIEILLDYTHSNEDYKHGNEGQSFIVICPTRC